MLKFYSFLFISVFAAISTAKTKSSPLQESVNIELELSGDLNGKYNLSGPVNSELESDSSDENSKCKLSALVRKISSKGRPAVEVWPKLYCTIGGQKKDFKLHRIYLETDKENQNYVVKAIDMKIQKIEFKFVSVNLKKNK